MNNTGTGRLTVCHLITRLIIGGAQENTLYTCYGLLERGHRVALLTGPPAGPEGSMMEKAAARDLEVRVIPGLGRQVSPTRDLASLWAVYRYLRCSRPDILHTHSAKAGILGRAAAALLGRSRPLVIHSIHGLPFHPYQPRLFNFIYIALEKAVEPFTDAFISVADAMTATCLKARIGNPAKYRTVYSAVPVDDFARAAEKRAEARRKYGFGENDLVIGKIARLFELKGHQLLIPVFARVRRACPRARLMLVGDGVLKPDIERLAEKHGVRDAVTFTGLLSPDEIPAAVAAMDLLVHASLREGLPRAVSQALAAGLPVVAFDIDGTREVVINGLTGYLVPAGNAVAFGDAMLAALGNYPGSVVMARAGQKLVRERFTIARMVEQIEATYREIAARNTRRRPPRYVGG